MTEPAGRLSAAFAGRYRIERELGAGGMATVYLAEDLKHDRKVAIKVLKPELAAVLGAERFVVEIKTTAAMSHPHILPLFDSGEAGGFLYYVMPYIQGETIREKLNRETQFGVDEAVRIAREVADALDYAHRHGVIHRDIKPENILLHDGRAMVMDFGIALAVSAAAGGRMTETGLSLGTPHYMSPEQATADKDITARSDIYSLASVLYEMLTGNPPHTGSSAQQIIMKIIAEAVQPVTALRKSVPPNVAAALGKALEKLPADRFGSARAFADALGNASFTTAIAGGATGGLHATRRASLLWPAAVLAVAALGAWGTWHNRGSRSGAVVRLMMVAGEHQLIGGAGRVVTITPDGSAIIYRGRAADSSPPERRLFVRALDDETPRPLPGTEGALYPFASPDSKWAGFLLGDTIKRIPIAGGAAEPIAVLTSSGAYAHWGDDGTIVFSDGRGLFTVPSTGGARTPVPKPDSIDILRPELLPGGKAIVGTVGSAADGRSVVLVDRATGAVTTLVDNGTHPHYVRTGHLVFGREGGGLFAVPFDISRRTVTGDVIAVIPDVAVLGGGATQFAVADNGTAVYLSGDGDIGLIPVESGTDGTERVLVPSGRFRAPAYSPSGGIVAAAMSIEGRNRIVVLDVARGVVSPRTFDGVGSRPVWTRDGKWLTYVQGGGGTVRGVYRVQADGSGVPELLLAGRGAVPGSWLPDDRGLLVSVERADSTTDIAVVSFEGDSAVVTPYLQDPWAENDPHVSPDGKWVAYVSFEGGAPNVFVRSFPTPRAKYQISNSPGVEPRWSRDGKTLFFRREVDGSLVAAELETGNTVNVVRLRETGLLGGQVGDGGQRLPYDVHPDGQRFVSLTGIDLARSGLHVVLNWSSLLAERSRKVR